MSVRRFLLLGAVIIRWSVAFAPVVRGRVSVAVKITARYEKHRRQTDPDSSWQKYVPPDHVSSSSPLRRKYEQSGGILYRQSVLTPDEFRVIKDELTVCLGKGGTLRLTDETSSSVASHRVGTRLPLGCKTVQILASPEGSISRLVNDVVAGGPMILSTDVPIEVRVYEKVGAGMEWHVDDVLFTPQQVEVVLTIENSSDCVTMWEEVTAQCSHCKRVEVETAANSAIIIKAGGARHRVSSLKFGRRVILKLAYVEQNAAFVDGAEKHINQFASESGKSSKKNPRGVSKGRARRRK